MARSIDPLRSWLHEKSTQQLFPRQLATLFLQPPPALLSAHWRILRWCRRTCSLSLSSLLLLCLAMSLATAGSAAPRIRRRPHSPTAKTTWMLRTSSFSKPCSSWLGRNRNSSNSRVPGAVSETAATDQCGSDQWHPCRRSDRARLCSFLSPSPRQRLLWSLIARGPPPLPPAIALPISPLVSSAR